MNTFHSSLTKLLDVRRREERKEQQNIAQLVLRIHWFRDRLKSLEEELERTEQGMMEARQLGELLKQQGLSSYRLELQSAITHIRQEQESLHRRLIQLQQVLCQKHQKRKVIEKIYQKQYTAWRKSLLKCDA